MSDEAERQLQTLVDIEARRRELAARHESLMQKRLVRDSWYRGPETQQHREEWTAECKAHSEWFEAERALKAAFDGLLARRAK